MVSSTSSRRGARMSCAPIHSMSARASAATTVRNACANTSPSTTGSARITSCPSDSSSAAASSSAATQSGCTVLPKNGDVVTAMRRRPGSRVTSSRNGRSCGGQATGVPASSPAVASSMAAESRTLRVITCSCTKPRHASPMSGPVGRRPRVGLMANTPLHDAGIRSEPPPSPPWAMGTMRAATAAPEPPLEPPVVLVGSHGLRAGPSALLSVNGVRPSSGVLALPMNTAPAPR